MSYMALYRKFRPTTFDQVKGQDHIVTTLKNQIRTGRIGHAYLFCGTRGTGKTTVAKILAKAVNCENPLDGEPCNQCAACEEIIDGSSMNVMEIDAASNNGVDNIRDIKEQVQYSPATGKYKVYIIDEVHMLSIGAFNALLKTLEEPPEYVIFILATTEVHKIPITILSRCQRYDFHRITADTIKKQLGDLMKQEQVDVEEKALEYIARMADGSMRDALSLLDQCIAFYLGKKLTYDNVLEVLGTVDIQVYSNLLDYILASDVTGVMNLLEDVTSQGREWSQFITDFLWYLRNLLLVGKGTAASEALEVSTDQLKLLQEKAKTVDENTLIRYIRILSELLNQLRFATSKRVLVEVEMIKMCRPQMEADQGSLLERVRQLEEQLNKLITSGITVKQPQSAGKPESVPKPEKDVNRQLEEKFPKAKIEELTDIVNHWREMKRSLSPQMKFCLQKATLTVNEEGNALKLMFPKEMNVESGYFLDEPERIDLLKQELRRQSGREVELEVGLMESREKQDMIDLECIHMDVNIEE
ncbi:DNA polymerase III subunit gamma/tau [Anaerostipes sp. 494a]|uniref:DNA polymerase III subunit gamma/tau n=1 Tax=Anaerostipes sp. 494a TaxID=1261636 RepID=UPI000AF2ACEE|nr:DNA polymerase III subunit gamma/tau [Anaerostipes sp. 494a]